MRKIFILSAAAAFAFGGDIEISGEFIKVTPPNAKNSAIFMTIKNNSNAEISLTSVSSSLSQNAEIHAHIDEDGMKKMVKVDELKIPANSQIELKPGGNHIMLINLKNPVKEGDVADLKLEFSNKESFNFEKIPSKKIEQMPMKHSHSM